MSQATVAARTAYRRAYGKTYRWQRAIHAAAWARKQAIKWGRPPGDIHWSVFARLYQLPCTYCGVTPCNGTDHELPLSRGGDNVVTNLVPACKGCNEAKGDRTPAEWAASRAPYPCRGCGTLITPRPQRVRQPYCTQACANRSLGPTRLFGRTTAQVTAPSASERTTTSGGRDEAEGRSGRFPRPHHGSGGVAARSAAGPINQATAGDAG